MPSQPSALHTALVVKPHVRLSATFVLRYSPPREHLQACLDGPHSCGLDKHLSALESSAGRGPISNQTRTLHERARETTSTSADATSTPIHSHSTRDLAKSPFMEA